MYYSDIATYNIVHSANYESFQTFLLHHAPEWFRWKSGIKQNVWA